MLKSLKNNYKGAHFYKIEGKEPTTLLIYEFFTVAFQRFCLDIQNKSFSGHVWMNLNTSESAKGDIGYVNSVKQVLIR